MIVRDAFKKFIRSRQQKGCSDQTIKSYECLTAHFIGFVGEDTEMEDLTQELPVSYTHLTLPTKLEV